MYVMLHASSISQPMRSKTKQIITCSRNYFCALSVSFVIGQCDTFGFSFFHTQLKTVLIRYLSHSQTKTKHNYQKCSNVYRTIVTDN